MNAAPPRPAKTTAPPNIALNRPAGASSACYGCTGNPVPTKAVDGLTTTAWVASGPSFPQWLVVDLGAITTLSTVTQAFANKDTWSFKIEGSNDNVGVQDAGWTVLVDHTTGVTGQTFTDNVTGAFRYVRVYITAAGANWASSSEFAITGTKLVQPRNLVPPPVAASTGNYLVGAQMCNLWSNTVMWGSIKQKLPTLHPLLGYYDEAYDVATDWQINMAVSHGISFFQSCWYREIGNAGHSPLMATYDQFTNSIANSAQYRSKIQWSILWVNDKSLVAEGASSEADFLTNVAPFWIANYFSRPNYLKIENKPVVSIYNPPNFISDLGGIASATDAISQFRKLCVQAGFAGVLILADNHQNTTLTNAAAAAVGFDDVFAYHIPTFTGLMPSTSPTGTQILSEQQTTWTNWQKFSKLPSLVSASMGWNGAPWGEGTVYWRLAPSDFTALLQNAKAAMAQRTGLASQVLMLDNWNEFGEGHYISPTTEYGYQYLDAITNVFSPSAHPPDLTPDTSKVPQIALP